MQRQNTEQNLRMHRRVTPDAPASPPPWRPPPPDLLLGRDEVHLWRIHLEALDTTPSPLDILSADERQRIARLHTESARRRFIATRTALRQILARYLAQSPEAIRFAYGAAGKPMLADARGDLQFNLSHSHALALCAVARERAVGVDVEHVRQDVRVGDIATRFFPPAEAAALAALPEPLRLRAFFASWARKEAWIKATGTTIWRGLGDAAHLPATDGSWADAFGSWYRTGIDAGPDYSAALVVAGGPVQPACWEWPPTASSAGSPPE